MNERGSGGGARSNAWLRRADAVHLDQPRPNRAALVLLALLRGWPDEFGHFGHVETHLLFNDLGQRDIRGAHLTGFDQRTAQAASARIELADPAGNEVDQNVGVANFLQCFLRKFSVQDGLLVLSQVG